MRVLIVDDERQTREGIRKHVGWEKWGVTEIDSARDGQDALEMLRSHSYDIAICDIRMPRMDGIRFAQHLYEFQPECRVIFLSGYADKEYLFSAIRLHAVAYVEKPFEIAELERAIDEAARQIQSQNRPRGDAGSRILQDKRSALALALIDAGNLNGMDLPARMEDAELVHEGSHFTSVLLSFQIPSGATDLAAIQREQSLSTLANRFNAPSHNYILCAREGNHLVVHLLSKPQEIPSIVTLISDAARQLTGSSCRVLAGVGPTLSGAEGAHKSYLLARKALERTFFVESTVIFYDRVGPLAVYRPNEFRRQAFATAVQTGDEARALEAADELFAELRSCDLSPRAAQDVVLSILGQLPDGDPAQDAALVRACHHIDALEQSVRTRIRDVLMKSTLYSGDNRTVREVLALIHSEYSNPKMNIAGLAHNVYLTPNYLSAVFKKETGMTINAYISQYRVAIAEKMLSDTSLHLYEIAVRCGFGSVENFSRIFKKVRGVLPSVLRKRM